MIIIAAYVGYGALCFALQRTLLYPGRSIRVPAGTPADIVANWPENGSGKAETWFFPATIPDARRRPALVFFHGNGEVIDLLAADAGMFRELGLHVLLVEYPGYGRSAGSPSEAAITAAAVAAYDLLAARPDVDSARIIAFGRSLGCGAACALARQRPVSALILQSPFTSTRPFARKFLLPGFLLRDVFDNRAVLATYRGPCLIFHGTRDDIVPVAHGRELAAIASRGEFVPLNCAHNDCPPDWGAFRLTISRFLKVQGILPRETPAAGNYGS
jgi:fermentation-respiration switch protein FrsA (DUF1100 family)